MEHISWQVFETHSWGNLICVLNHYPTRGTICFHEKRQPVLEDAIQESL